MASGWGRGAALVVETSPGATLWGLQEEGVRPTQEVVRLACKIVPHSNEPAATRSTAKRPSTSSKQLMPRAPHRAVADSIWAWDGRRRILFRMNESIPESSESLGILGAGWGPGLDVAAGPGASGALGCVGGDMSLREDVSSRVDMDGPAVDSAGTGAGFPTTAALLPPSKADGAGRVGSVTAEELSSRTLGARSALATADVTDARDGSAGALDASPGMGRRGWRRGEWVRESAPLAAAPSFETLDASGAEATAARAPGSVEPGQAASSRVCGGTAPPVTPGFAAAAL